MKIKTTFLMIALMIFSMSAFSQLSTVVKIDAPENEQRQDVEITVTWELSDGTTISNQISADAIKDGDMISVDFTGTTAQAAMVTNTTVSVTFSDESAGVSKSFANFKFSVTCSYGEEDEDKWYILRLY